MRGFIPISILIVLVAIFGIPGAVADEQTTEWHFSTAFVDRFVTDIGEGVTVLNYGYTPGQPGIAVRFGDLNFSQKGRWLKVKDPIDIFILDEDNNIIQGTENFVMIAGKNNSTSSEVNVTVKRTGNMIAVSFDDISLKVIQRERHHKSLEIKKKGLSDIFVRCQDRDIVRPRIFLI